MGLDLRTVSEECISKISGYLEQIPNADVSFHAPEYYHLMNAKRSLIKALLVSDKYNFSAHKLTKFYDDQLNRLREKYSIKD